MSKLNVCIVGATGNVGRMFIKILEERNFPIDNIYFLASKRSKGKKIKFKEKEYTVLELTKDFFETTKIHLAFFSAGSTISKEFAPFLASKNIVVIDNSSCFRMDKTVPLIVPEINYDHIKNYNSKIIANPNCSTIQSVMPLKVLHEKYKIKRIVFSTYQAVSGSGMKGIEDYENGIENFYNKLKGKEEKKYTLKAYNYEIVNNVLPEIDVFLENGYTKEEEKMINETKKILNDENIKITATAARVPVLNSHSISINLEFENKFNLKDIFTELKKQKGLIIQDDISKSIYPTAIKANGSDDVFIGRIRRDFSLENGLNMWVVADNIRRGAASNAVITAEKYFNIN